MVKSPSVAISTGSERILRRGLIKILVNVKTTVTNANPSKEFDKVIPGITAAVSDSVKPVTRS